MGDRFDWRGLTRCGRAVGARIDVMDPAMRQKPGVMPLNILKQQRRIADPQTCDANNKYGLNCFKRSIHNAALK